MGTIAVLIRFARATLSPKRPRPDVREPRRVTGSRVVKLRAIR